MDALFRWLPMALILVVAGVLLMRLGRRLLASDSGRGDVDSGPGVLGLVLLGGATVGCLVVSVALGSAGFDRLRRQRDLERVPRTEVLAAMTGEINLSGRAEPDEDSGVVHAPRSHVPSLYYHYTEEEKTTDSDGDTKWEVVDRREAWAPTFRLIDDSGSIAVRPADGDVFRTSGKDLGETVGNRRYSEWRIEPGESVFVFGFARVDAEGLGEVVFDAPGRYSPIVAEGDEVGQRRGMATVAIFLIWGGLAALSFAVYFGGWLARMHKSPTYLAVLATAMVVGLGFCGLRMVHADLVGARDRLDRARGSAREAVGDLLRRRGISWEGDWGALGRFDDPAEFAPLDERERRRLRRLRIDLARAVLRANAIRDRFPERQLAPLWGVSAAEPVPLPGPDAEELSRLDRQFEAARLGGGRAGGVGAGALVLAVVGSWIGLRKVKEKRYIENVPTSPTVGVAVGFAEVVGTIEPAFGGRSLTGPLSDRPCVQFHYTVQERRGTGKNAKWVTIEDRAEQVGFDCRDDHGRLFVLPEGAEILTRHHDSRQEGKLRYGETRLEVGDPLYALGSATIEPEEMASLRLERGNDRSLPYILSNYSEPALMHRKARVGQFWVTLALDALILPTLLGFGVLGSFQATDFLAATGVAIGYFALAVAILMFNDLVFLRNRVRRAWHNIDVSLKKRADLVPSLQEIVDSYLSHERGVQEELSLMRRGYGGGVVLDPTRASEVLTAERSLLGRITGLREAHPELKGDTLTGDLMRRLTLLENEVALMRQGYNDAVERYNTRIAHVPEVLLAACFGFPEASYFRAEVEVRQAPRVELAGGGA
ncbi:LemA family protein [Tautonia plasticadhaerens]|uniref:LemA family protein n=1 Tax=Tautonia plasticadhaerens TaxID=2527974 RepID=A0A518H127_9BACT|nr:LemA family protein [Tautonia plasticadhaerens]QDV34528.1 LemA family protein [Tautonia plasticadhaerens]